MSTILNWTVEFYKDSKGIEPVAEFLDSLPVETKAKATRLLVLLSKQGTLLKEPYVKHIRGKLWELRIKDKYGAIRIFYFSFTGKIFVLLHGFLKKTDKAPVQEIEIAEKRMIDFIQRIK